MKQSHLGGRCRGLRPSQQRQLERLSHRRHPEDCGADLLSLERLADLVLDLEMPLHLVLDGRGLCRLLWLGPLSGSDSPLQHLPATPRRSRGGWRLISCPFSRKGLQQDHRDAVIALDLAPRHWLRFGPCPSADGSRPAELLIPDPLQPDGWRECAQGDLRDLCSLTPDEPQPQSIRAAAGEERVLLLTLTSGDEQRDQRDLAELEGLVRSAGACLLYTSPSPRDMRRSRMPSSA